nr:hypothetical protein [Tanacetum cinerariifolium]
MKDCLNDNVSKIKALLLDTDEKLKIALNENPKDSDLKMGNDLPKEAVKDNEVLKEEDDVLEKGKDVEKEMNKEKDVEMVVVQNIDKPKAVKDKKVSNEVDDVTEKEKDVEKVVELGGKKQFRTDCETLEEANFPSIVFEDIESLKGGGRNLFDEKSTV